MFLHSKNALNSAIYANFNPFERETMKKASFAAVCMTMIFALTAFCADSVPIWPNNAPDESAQTTEVKGLVVPTYQYCPPAEKKSDACLIVCPGGGYNNLAVDHEGDKIAEYFNSKGITVVILKYRIPRRQGKPKHLAAWQDAQRTVRIVRSKADEWGINPEKIGILGFSAGGHLTLMTATTSQTPAYEPVDELDKTVPCHVNFAAPIYPAYVLDDGADSNNTGKGNDAKMVSDFAFDEKTPPMCLIHGDNDPYSPMGSVAVYHKLRTMGIPGELHIFATVGHGFGANPTGDHIGDWLNRVYAWMKAVGIY